MDADDILDAMAKRAKRTVPALREAWGSGPNTIEQTPTLVMFWNGQSPTRIEHTSAGQMWIVPVKGRIYGELRAEKIENDMRPIRKLITLIVDAFAVNPDGFGVNEYLPELTDHVDRIQATGANVDILLRYAGQLYAGAEIFFEIKFHHIPEYMP